MDTLNPPKPTPVKSAEEVEAVIATIKAHMPETYQAIKDKAATLGKAAFGMVRAGIKGEPNCFYAFEAGHVVGTRFNQPDVQAHIAMGMVTLGISSWAIWPDYTVQQQVREQVEGAGHGTH
jgi:hypothetical protein